MLSVEKNLDHINHTTKHINLLLEKILTEYNDSLQSSLPEAIRYSVLNGGKRLRPLLVYATGESLHLPTAKLNASAIALELVHCYSLIHDDLPAMDNDTLRRGKPTCHIAFGEDTAILAGDALQSLAFEVLTNDQFNPVPDSQKISLVKVLAKASGVSGMVGGQALDMAASLKPNANISQSTLSKIHQKKTGALIKAAIQMPCIIAELPSSLTAELMLFADCLGLAYQIQDDILDVEGSSKQLGKTPGKDVVLNKQTYPGLLGLKGAKKQLNDVYQQACDVLSNISKLASNNELIFDSKRLFELLDFFIYRIH